MAECVGRSNFTNLQVDDIEATSGIRQTQPGEPRDSVAVISTTAPMTVWCLFESVNDIQRLQVQRGT